jgi:pimeloyl-ACP methyl ester carboxylesterase
MFLPVKDSDPNYMPPNLILYCHCNASNKLECKTYVEYLPVNYAMAAFDFLGCGNSPNMYISLGYRESDQVRTLINFLRPRFQRIIPWGRSMGAASVLLYG